jgi:tripartite-type tricarboxylate transporter receptor subunit TctC
MLRAIALAVLLLAPLGPIGPAQAAWPERPVSLIVPFAAGASPDVFGRLIADRLSALWGQPVVVQNVPGAGATIGVDKVVRSAPDGYVIGLTGDGAMVVRISMDPPIAYDPRRDLAPVSLLVRTRNILLVHPSVPVRTLQDLIALAKAQPGKLNYGHSGAGFSTHLGVEMLKQAAGIDITAVPYANDAAMVADTLQNRVQLTLGGNATNLPRVQNGSLRALAVSSRDRIPALPDVPTIAESGFPGFEAAAWFALVAPRGTPADIVARVQRDTVAVLQQPAMSERLSDMGFVPVGTSAEQFAQLIPGEIERMAGVLERLGLRRAP